MCAASGGNSLTPTACWELCIGGNWVAMVWKNGECDCVHKNNIGTCDEGTINDYEYHESDPTLCDEGHTIFQNLYFE